VSPRASVLVATHSHGRLLGPAVRSALRQTMRDLEVLIVGDGATPETAACARELAASDPRVRWFEFPKGERHGELHRHRVLTEDARGEAVLYLSDDDLWLDDHAEHLLGLLERADFANALSCWLRPDGTAQATLLDMAEPFGRAAVLAGDETPSLTVVGHTLDAYRRLPEGWRVTPEDVHTDSWMWRQFLGCDWVRAASGALPTVVHLPSPLRGDWTLEERMAELERYEKLSLRPGWRREHAEAVLVAVVREGAWLAGDRAAVQLWGEDNAERLREVWDEQAALAERLAEAERWLEAQSERLAEAERLLADRDARLAALEGSVSWRLTAPLRRLRR
jgi:hypothetical protein